jgi:heterokaryon incompatibility protein (HET)
VEEKNHQVPIMGQIYSKASETLIFLGPSSNGLRDLIVTFWRYQKNRNLERLKEDDQQHVLPSFSLRQAFNELCVNDWFRRAWVVQESVLSQRPCFVLGEHRFGFSDFHDFIMKNAVVFGPFSDVTNSSADNLDNLWTNFGIQRLDDIDKMRTHGGVNGWGWDSSNLVYLLSEIAPRSHVSDPRDLVYAFLGMQSGLDLRPDYKLSTDGVYTETAAAIIEQTKNLALFGSLERHGLSKIDSPPSWVPDWRMVQRIRPFSTLSLEGLGAFAASRGRPHKALPRGNHKQLFVHGAIIDVVTECFRPDFSFADENDQLAMELDPWGGFIERTTCAEFLYSTGYVPKVSERRLLKILLAEGCVWTNSCAFLGGEFFGPLFYEHHEEETFEEYETIRAQAQNFKTTTYNSNSYPRNDAQALGTASVSSRLSTMSLITHHRQPFKAEGDRYGLVNLNARVGDVISILHGSKVPIVLRPSSNDTYQVVGQCYLEGCMYGEEVTWEENEAQEFRLV